MIHFSWKVNPWGKGWETGQKSWHSIAGILGLSRVGFFLGLAFLADCGVIVAFFKF